jgi:hypothetical protein
MQPEKFEVQCEADINHLVREFGESRRREIIVIYNRVKEKMMAEAKITEFLHILIEKEVRNELTKEKILIK